ncbi:MAG: alpha-1,6-mannanase [Bacteroidaceae bacterium]|nr:alpha-1,6-mannanase [Bacteroidaceae bacterium]
MTHLPLPFLLSFLFFLASSNTSAEETAPSYLANLQRAIAITDATMNTSFTGTDLRMYDTYNTATKTGSGTADVWPYTAALEAHCSVLEALELFKNQAPDLYEQTHERFVARLRQLFNNLGYYRGTYTLNSYAQRKSWSIYGVHRSGSVGQAAVTGIENVYDDQMWLCRELVRAYRLTGYSKYLDEATMLANYCIDGWDCCLDKDGNEYGGISWGPGYNSKHSCSNAPLIQPLVWLADIYRADDEPENLRYYYILPDGTRTSVLRRHSELYMEFARKIYAWQKEKLLNHTTGVYWDMCGAVKGEIQYEKVGRIEYRAHVDIGGPTGTAYTYNTGTMLAATAELLRTTGEQTYRNDLNALCRSSYNQFSKGRRISGVTFREWPTDPQATSGFNTWFDDVLMRAFVDAHPYNDANNYATMSLNSFQQNLDYAWDNHLRDNQLPIHLIDGWDNGDVTKGFHQLAFASEYAMLAVWQQRRQQTDAIKTTDNHTLNPQHSISNTHNYYTLSGLHQTHPFRRGLYVVGGHKVAVK